MTAVAKDPDRIAVHAAVIPAGAVAPLRSQARGVVPVAAAASPATPVLRRPRQPGSRPHRGQRRGPARDGSPTPAAPSSRRGRPPSSPWRLARVESDVAEVAAHVCLGLAGLGGAVAARPVARRTARAVAGHQLMPHTAWARTRSG